MTQTARDLADQYQQQIDTTRQQFANYIRSARRADPSAAVVAQLTASEHTDGTWWDSQVIVIHADGSFRTLDLSRHLEARRLLEQLAALEVPEDGDMWRLDLATGADWTQELPQPPMPPMRLWNAEDDELPF